MNGARSCASITRSSFSLTATTRPTWPTPADGRTPAASSRPSPASSAPHPAATESATRPAPPPDLDRHAPSAEHLYLSPARTSALLANGSRPARGVTSGERLPGPTLVALADRQDDLLIVGYGGRARLGCTVHGTVTRCCMAHARCPMLAVPPPDLIRELRPRYHKWRA